MRSCGRWQWFALLAVTGLAFGSEPPQTNHRAVPPDGTPGALPLGSVTVVGQTSCPVGAANGAKCEEITVACPGLPDLNATLGVAKPTGASIGTVVLHAGGPGTAFLNSGFPNDYLGDGFNVVQIAWASDWAAANGAGVRSAACRPATVFNFAFQTVHHSSKSKGFCGQGISGGGAALGYSLADYGLAGDFDYVVIASGPGVSRMDYGCDPPLYQGPPRNLCSLLPDAPFTYSQGDANKVNMWEGTTTCGTANPSSADIARWAQDSVFSAGADYVYPKTAMSWFFCVTTPVSETTGEGSFLIQQVVPKNSPPDVNCYSGTCKGEGVWQDPNAFDATVSEMVSQCVANH